MGAVAQIEIQSKLSYGDTKVLGAREDPAQLDLMLKDGCMELSHPVACASIYYTAVCSKTGRKLGSAGGLLCSAAGCGVVGGTATGSPCPGGGLRDAPAECE
jgi:hypothetical protein